MSSSHNDPSDYKVNKLKSSDQIRFLLYNEAVLQEVATHGGNQYIKVDNMGVVIYSPPNLELLSTMSAAADERYYQNSNLQMELAKSRREHQQFNNANSYQRLQQAVNAAYDFGYDAGENDRQRFLESKLTKGRKETTEMITAVAHVFKFILNTTDNFLAEKVRGFSSRSATAANVNLVEALQFLKEEMKGNPVANREACLAQIDKLRIATSLSELRFVVDVFVAVTTSVATSIRLYGGNGMLTNSQIHFKLLERMSPDSPSLTLVRMKVSALDPDLTSLARIRAEIKVDLDRAVDPLATVARSGVLSTSRGAALHVFQEPSATCLTNLSASVAGYNMAAVSSFDPAAFMAETIQKATSQATENTIALLRGANAEAAGNDLKSYYGGGSNGLRGGGGGPRPDRTNICTAFLYGDCERGSICRFQHPARLAGTMKDTNVAATASAPTPLKSAFKDGVGRIGVPSRPGSPTKSTGMKRPGSPAPQGPRKIQFGKAYNAMADGEDGQDQEDVEEGYAAWNLQH